MSPAQQRGLALWAGLLSALVCLLFLPVPRWGAWLILLVTLALIIAILRIARRGAERQVTSTLHELPAIAYRQPVVLVCGDLPCVWPQPSPVRVVKQGCWIRVEKTEELPQVARQILSQRPEWGSQLSVLLCVCPQRHAQSDALTSALLALRWQISQLRQQTGYAVPLALQGQVGSAMSPSLLWQAAIPGEAVKVWQPSCSPCSVSTWLSVGGAAALQQQVLMNSLMGWFERHVLTVLTEENADLPPLTPAAVLWGIGPTHAGSLASSAWTRWLSRHTGLTRVAGWQPGETDTPDASSLPDFILSQLPAGRGLTPRGRAGRAALAIFTLAAVAALLSSGWNNRQLLQRVGVDIARYERIAMDDYGAKASAVRVLREDAALLDSWARNGVPLRLSLGLYRGERIRLPLLEAIRRYVPPPPPPKPVQRVAPHVIRLDSMSLFDTGKWVLKPGSTKRLVHSLVDIKARPGWLIVVAGHTDSVGEEKANQLLSLKRAESVREWMRDTGDVPDSCFAVQGYGESRPIATNDTPEGRALNRRVEISLVPQVDACRLPDKPSASSQDDGASLHNGE
ncbi:TPA: OmpA family protein [Klebsiella quasipneumoniae subsp. quasipneumoniae]|uniref:Membrane protein n=1 Tax=Klebsiella quasipneumoniae subsp. quasipneumoniae TaxID=1667327 RepID=A0AAN1Y5I6_9ENTR|nr:OmpA family protein [Klebsiella quasipneumoniae]MDX7606697.1 OmpA family protein [Klebsiella quasipneumoniae]BDO03314.1 membrane protein [Klebsiella quasipneumoniae subsp. quasipneumoniae]BDO13753.1 membrane protein [Klebsiella quasipneumoniae subsp. quasipneumoniae]BDO19724.1 membrane protein [Klebsiella quasipneumoniae subsp. quasipneumoniae]HCI6413568.1 OmpA family protein [Klebsiella quasipneumoniae subsp. quasipneumoniae]